MNLKLKFTLPFLLVLFVSSTTFAQKLIPAMHAFSHKKTSYVTLEDGTELEGELKDLDRKKGLIEEVTLKDADGKKHKIKPEDIKHMYLPPSGLSKLAAAYEFLYDATQWDDNDLEKDIIGKGYAYFEKSDVQIKNKTKVLLLQLLNPSFSSKIRVYSDPFAGETASVGIGNVKLAGGDEKSYYVKKGDKAAYKLKKKDYRTDYDMLFKDCSDLKKIKQVKWSEFAEHVFKYNKC
jgi:hypothetical protein